MKYGCLFAVKEIQAARAFYKERFHLTAENDFGRNFRFSRGPSLQQDFHPLTGVPKDQRKDKGNDCKLFFEVDDLDRFVRKLRARKDVPPFHGAVERSWWQRLIRF